MRALMTALLLFAIAPCAILWPVLWSAPAGADELDVDLSRPDVQLDVSFEGSDLLLFGAKDQKGDVIVVVRGPERQTSMRLQQRVMGVWVRTDEVIFDNAPSYYALASSRPVAEVLPESVLKAEQIGTERLQLRVSAKPEGASPQTVQNFYDGLLRNMTKKHLYTAQSGEIELIGKQLFRTDLWFPATVQVGDYQVDTYLISNGRIENKKTTHLQVHKVGIEAQVYNFAHQHALIYGLLAVLIAVVSGWTANAVFRKKA